MYLFNMKIEYRIILMILVLSQLAFHVDAQKKFGNEWINPSKNYLKLKVAENGIYKLTYEEMVAAGFIDTKINGSYLQLINYGTDQALYVSDNDFGPGDHIEFYGEKNTIGLDSLLYADWRKDLLNPDYSLVNDTNAYFLAISPEKNNIRYTLKNPNFGSTNLTPFPYYLHEEKLVFSKKYYKNAENKIRNTIFEPSEGFCNDVSQSSSVTIKSSHLVSSGPDPMLSIRMGLNSNYSKLEILWNGLVKQTKTSEGKKTLQFNINLSKSELTADNTLKINNIQSTLDNHFLSNAGIVYPREFDFGGKSIYTFSMAAMASQRLLEINNFNNAGDVAVLYDPINKLRYNTKQAGNKLQAIIDATTKTTSYFLANSVEGMKKVPSITNFKPKSFANVGQQYVIISHKALYATGPNYVQEYADYRSSQIGGGYKTEIVDIQHIYDHFGYGIDRHFQGVKQFAAFMKENWTDTKFVFLIGKGLEYPYIRTTNDVINYNEFVFFIPTYGYSGSDNMLFSEGNYPDPYFAVGRLAARSADDVKNYLEKIKEYDLAPFAPQTIEEKSWLKNVMHLGGGGTDTERLQIKTGLELMGSIITDTIYGADLHSFYKKSSDPIEYNVNEEINTLYENGVRMLNFFGHSAATSWEFSIDNPRNYDNFGKYPFINSFGCLAGNLHGPSKGISESFVLEKNRGSITFFATTGYAFIHDLSFYGNNLFKSMFEQDRNAAFGTHIKNLATKNRNSTGNLANLYAQLTLHGDPALKFHFDPAPDYLFDPTSVKTTPSNIQASMPDFHLDVTVFNIGSYQSREDVDVTVLHIQPDGKKIDTIRTKVNEFANKKNLIIALKNYGSTSVGKHKILAKIDENNIIKEWPNPDAEQNNDLVIDNQLGFEFYVSDNIATTIYPPDFAMINTKDHFILKASTSSVPLAKGDYIFQIDTTAYFNSPILEKAKVVSEGGLITYEPKMQLVKDRVYYWRVSPDSINPQGYKWSQASFAYLPDEDEGWNQSHYFQFTQNDFNDLEISEQTNRKFEFGKNYTTVKLVNKIWDAFDQPGYIFNGNNFGSFKPWKFMDAGIAMVVNNTTKTWHLYNTFPGLYGSFYPVSDQPDTWAFKTTTPEERKIAMDFIENQVNEGKIISFFTILANSNSDFKPKDWAADSLIYGKSLFTVLEKLGAKKIRELEQKGSVPYILQAVNENNIGVLSEKIGNDKYDILESTSLYPSKKTAGNVTTKQLPPAQSYKNLLFSIQNLSQNLSKSIIYLNTSKNNGTIISLDSTITSPYQFFNIHDTINLQFANINKTSRKPNSMDYWRVSYTPYPDAAILFNKIEPSSSLDLKQGETLKIYYDVTNVNYVPMDSILVKYTYTSSSNQSTVSYKKLRPLGVGDKISDVAEFSIGTGNLSDVRIIIEINPEQNQPELYTFNNVLSKQFDVAKDDDNPLLDIYFDGLRIMDGDIVSPKPEILVTLSDENNLLPIADPTLFEVKLDTGRNQIIEIPMSSPQIKFIPASGNTNTAKLMYYPTLKEGEYTLYVQGKDATGNKSGINPRSVQFKVIEKQSVSNILNYPNPFSTSTQFIFTLTGEELPDIMSISIMTLTGKVVKEITKDQLGPLRIGVNRTEYKWDGTDEFGSKLANGVYLYKVNSRKKNGEKYDPFSINKIDSLFKEGFGKLVILR